MGEKHNDIIANVKTWLEQVVINLNLCPFAKAPYQKKQVRFVVCTETLEEDINASLIEECLFLDQHDEIETSLIICPAALSDFFTYNRFLLWAQQTLKQYNWRGTYQIASFHPDYVFANTETDDVQNFTNRAPYPILHLLRESSLETILDRYSEAASIPDNNIQTMQQLTQSEIERLFPYLFSS